MIFGMTVKRVKTQLFNCFYYDAFNANKCRGGAKKSIADCYSIGGGRGGGAEAAKMFYLKNDFSERPKKPEADKNPPDRLEPELIN